LMIANCLRITVMVFLTIGMVVTGGLWYLYKLKTDGVIFLEGIDGNASITREVDTGIAHIRGANFHSALFGQGFAHAQTRLWKLEATRRVFSGTASEIFGKDALPIDKFTRSIGYKRLAQETYDNMSQEDKNMM
jgi:penicillin amidase